GWQFHASGVRLSPRQRNAASPRQRSAATLEGKRNVAKPSHTEINLNGTRYRWPDRPVVVICNDGGDPAYIDAALREGAIPTIARFMRSGFSSIAQCVIPSFTCPNNVSIVTGSPPSIHGISGNFYLDPA